MIDEGERFPLERLEGGIHLIDGDEAVVQNLVAAKKVRFSPVIDGKEAEFFANVIITCGSTEGIWYRHDYRFSILAWGCYRGRATLDGRVYEIILRDGNADGIFCDFDERSWLTQPDWVDTVAFIPEGSPPMLGIPLRRKILLDQKGYSVAVHENGRKMVIEPDPVTLGEVGASSDEIEMALWNADWGAFIVPPGEVKNLPSGIWLVTEFVRHCSETGARCNYWLGSNKGGVRMEAVVEAGKTTIVTLVTIVKGEIIARRRTKDRITFALRLTTPQDASLHSIECPPDCDDPFDGVPVIITNSAGAIVAQDLFEFHEFVSRGPDCIFDWSLAGIEPGRYTVTVLCDHDVLQVVGKPFLVDVE